MQLQVAGLRKRIAGAWLARRSSSSDDGAVQRRLHEAAAPFIGSIRGGDPNRAQEASRRVRAKLVRGWSAGGSPSKIRWRNDWTGVP